MDKNSIFCSTIGGWYTELKVKQFCVKTKFFEVLIFHVSLTERLSFYLFEFIALCLIMAEK